MENRISKLKTDFNNITTTRSNVKNIFDILQTKIHKLKFMYSEFINNSKTQLFVFGLDSFHFQSKLIDIEYDDMKRLFLAINNRMYCEYFKLYKIIVDYITKNVVDKKISEIIKVNNFPIYKDLEPFKEYKFELVLELHENILILLTSIISKLNSKENELILHQSKKNIGLNIDNFITSFNYEIIMMREKVIMFLTYIEFFHKLHIKYLKRFNNKIQLMYTNINNDIKFDESVVDESTIEIINDEITTENLSIKNINTNNTNEVINNIGYSVPRSPTSSVHSESDDSNHSKISGISNVSEKMLVESKTKTIGGMLKNGINRLLNSCNTIIKESVKEKVITNTEISTVFANIENTCETILSNKIEAISENIEIQIVEVQTKIEDKVEDIQNQIEEAQNQIEEQVEEVQTQIEEQVEEAQTQIEEAMEDVQNQIEETVEDVQNQIEEQVEESQNKVDDLVNEVIEEVKEVENNMNDDLSVLTEDLNSVTKEDQKTEEEVAKEPKKKRVYKSRKK